MKSKKWIVYAGFGLLVFALSQIPGTSGVDNQISLPPSSLGENFVKITSSLSVAPQLSSNCADPEEKEGWMTCTKTYSNGIKQQITNYQESFGTQFKRQTQITELLPDGKTRSVKTVRLKTVYEYVGNERRKKSEYFDIVTRPSGKKITRQIILYRYDSETQKKSYGSWTQYEQIGDEMFASLVQHVVLNYDAGGAPLTGRAERWKDQISVESSPIDLQGGKVWENEMLSASPSNLF